MNNKQKFLLAAAFAAASIGSVTVTAICMCMVIFSDSEDHLQALSMEAMALALCEGVVSSLLGIVTTLLRIVGGHEHRGHRGLYRRHDGGDGPAARQDAESPCFRGKIHCISRGICKTNAG